MVSPFSPLDPSEYSLSSLNYSTCFVRDAVVGRPLFQKHVHPHVHSTALFAMVSSISLGKNISFPGLTGGIFFSTTARMTSLIQPDPRSRPLPPRRQNLP